MADVNLKTELNLNNLRDLVLRLESSQKKPIRDANPLLAPICELLESLLRIGLKRNTKTLRAGAVAVGCHYYGNELSNQLKMAIKTSKVRSGLWFKEMGLLVLDRGLVSFSSTRKTNAGSLTRDHVHQIIKKGHFISGFWPAVYSSGFDEEAHGICCADFDEKQKTLKEIFKQILEDLDKHSFELNLKNASFLEETWIIPEVKESCIVPCKELGLIVRDVNDRVIVAQVKPNGAAEDAGIEYGDTIDELLGKPLLRIKNCNKVIELLKQNVGKPVSCTVVKAKLSNGTYFPPSWERIKVIKEDPYIPKPDEKFAPQQLASLDETAVHASDTVASYSALYFGKWETGEDGSIGVIEDGINCVIKQARQPQEVELNLTETDLTVVDKNTSKVMSVHSFTETSACGRKNDTKDIIAFVSGETSCALAKKFHCHVFKVKDQDIARVILYSIADGFCRTVWFV